MKRVAVFFAVLALAIVAFAQFVRRTSMFFPDRYPQGDWSRSGIEDQWITTSDGVRLHGWIFRAADPQAPLLVFFHGNAGNITDRAPIAAELAKRGVSTLLFDWRGYGKSGGSPSESALYKDADAAYFFAAAIAPPQRISLYGESLGGPYAAWVANRRGAHAIILDSTFPSLSALANTIYSPLPLGWTAPFALRTRAWVNESGVPALVLHSTRDDVIPYRLGRQLFDELRVPKEMLTSGVRGHCAMSQDEAHYYPTVVRFVTSPHPR